MRLIFHILLVVTAILAMIVPGVVCAESYTLRYNLEPGAVLDFEIRMNQNVEQTLMGQNMKMDQTIGFDLAMEVLAVQASGDYDVKITYKRVIFDSANPMMPFSYDSDSPSGASDPVSAMMGALVGKSFEATLTRRGNMTDIRGTEEMIQAVIDAMPGDEQMKTQISGMISDQVGGEAMVGVISQGAITYPEEPVAVGETWSDSIPVVSNFEMVIESKYTLAEVSEDFYRIEATSVVTKAPGAGPAAMGPMTMEYEISGSQAGSSMIDRATGVTRQSDMTNDLDVSLSMRSRDPNQPPIQMPMKIKSQIHMTAK